MTIKPILALSFAATMLTFAGCGSDGNSSSNTQKNPNNNQNTNPNPNTPVAKYANLTGTAAIGEAIANTAVVASCKDKTGFKDAVKTDSKGNWSGQVDESKLPCALQVKSGNQTYHSYASKAGNYNITPFTDLAIALASTQSPETWFKTYQPLAENQLKKAVTDLSTQLIKSGYVLPEGFDVLASKFAIGDTADKALDAFADALVANSTVIKDYAALIDLLKSGNLAQIPPIKRTDTPIPPKHTGSCSGNTNEWGCLNIAGTAVPTAHFDPIGRIKTANNQTSCDKLPSANLQASTGKIEYFRTYNSSCVTNQEPWYDTLQVSYQTINGEKKYSVTYMYYQLNEKSVPTYSYTGYCSDSDITRPCTGLSLDATGQKISFNNLKVISIPLYSPTGKAESVVLNGTLKFKAALPEPIKSDYGSMTVTGVEASPITFRQKNADAPEPKNESSANQIKIGWSEITPLADSLIPKMYSLGMNHQYGNGVGGDVVYTLISFNVDMNMNKTYTCVASTNNSYPTTTPCTGKVDVDPDKKSLTLQDVVLFNLQNTKQTIKISGTMTY